MLELRIVIVVGREMHAYHSDVMIKINIIWPGEERVY
jgi:hypothetical protein